MIDVTEVLRRLHTGQSARQLARDGVVDRKSIRPPNRTCPRGSD
jgi:hypothetical protein